MADNNNNNNNNNNDNNNNDNNNNNETLQVSDIICHRGGDERNKAYYYQTNMACQLSDVCWDRNRGTFTYFQPPGVPDQYVATPVGTFTLQDALKKYAKMINLNRNKIYKKDVPLPLRIVTTPVLKSDLKYHNASVNVIFESYYSSNFGHAVMDDAMPIYSLMKMFDKLTSDVQVMTLSDLAGEVGRLTKRQGSEYLQAINTLMKLISMLSDRQPIDISQQKSFKKVRYTCFRHLLAGHGSLGLMHDNGYAVSDFSRYMLQQLGRQNQNCC